MSKTIRDAFPSTTTTNTTPEDRALLLARGCYQRAIVEGDARLSGADLRGKASKYGSHYERSRRAVLGRIAKAGIPAYVERGPHGLLTLSYGEPEGEPVGKYLGLPLVVAR